MKTVTLFDPTAPRGQAAPAGKRAAASLKGAVVGFIDNAKPNFNHLVDDLAGELVARYGVARVVKRRKRSASVPAPDEMLREITGECDVVIAGSGDWGSCASWSVHDSVEAVKRGRAAVTICSTAFTTLGRAQASALGRPDLPIAVIEHPFGLKTRDEVRALAAKCADDIARLLGASAGA